MSPVLTGVVPCSRDERQRRTSWSHQLVDDLAAASETDRKLLLDLAKRLAR
jgi:hypothetical protein